MTVDKVDKVDKKTLDFPGVDRWTCLSTPLTEAP